MIDFAATAWLRSPGPPISNDVFYRSRALQARFYQNETRPRAQRDNVVYMPENDLANLGKHREHGVAYVCGDFVEVCTLVSTHITGTDTAANAEGIRPSSKEEKDRQKERNIKKSSWRARKQVRRLVNANRCRYMWTLTLAPPSPENKILYDCIPLALQRDYDAVRMLWKAFLRRFKRELGGRTFKWILVLELHDSKRTSDEKRGTWHLHFATPDRLEWEDILHFWSHGHVRFDDFQKGKKGRRKGEVQNPGAYMSKYIGKNFDESNFHRKRYTRSRDTETPRKISLEEWLNCYFSVNDELVFRTEQRFVSQKDGIEYISTNLTLCKKRAKEGEAHEIKTN